MLLRIKASNYELRSHTVTTIPCGCSNKTTLRGEVISANDLSQVIIVETNKETKKPDALSQEDRIWQENRRKRKVRRLDFEIR